MKEREEIPQKLYKFKNRTLRFVKVEDIRFTILEYKDNKIDAKQLVEKLEQLINKYE